MILRKHALALGLSLIMGAGGASLAMAQGSTMGSDRENQAPGMMMGGGQSAGMMGGQSNQGSGMMGGQGGTGSGMMGCQGGMGSGMMKGMMGGGMMGGMGPGMMQMLEPEQRAEMRELMQAHRPAQFERMGQMMNLHDDLMVEMHAERPDPEAVKEQHARMAELHGEMMAEMVRMQNAMHDLMTDEQRKQLQQATPE